MALSSASPVRPGDTLWLRGGTYVGKFSSVIAGAPGQPITVRSHPGEWARIDSGPATNRANILQIQGGWTVFRDLEVMSSDPVRTSVYTGSYPKDITRGEAIHALAPHIKLINLVVHDAAQGLGLWTEAPDCEVTGCIIYNNGWQGPDRAHGHGIYGQNESGVKLISDNLVFNQFEKGIQVYGSSSASLKNFQIQGNTLFNNGVLSSKHEISENITIYGGATGPQGMVLRDNNCYGTGYEGKLVIGGDGAKDLIFENNYVPHLTRIRYWQSARVTGNTFFRTSTMMEWHYGPEYSSGAFVWDGNRYFGPQLQYPPFATYRKGSDGVVQGKAMSFDGWRAETGFDKSGSFLGSRPVGARVVVRPNLYEAGRAMVTVYNWEKVSSVPVNLGNLLAVGQPFEVRNAQDYFAPPVYTGSYSGAALSLPMNGLTVAAPIGVVRPAVTGPEFNVFVVLPKGPPPASNTAPSISSIANQTTLENRATEAIAFSVSDKETAAEKLGVLGSSSNPVLVPNSNIVLSGSGTTRTVTVTPAAGQSGTATIVIAASDGALVTKTAFGLSVQTVNQAPVISLISDQNMEEDTLGRAVAFSISDRETAGSQLVVRAESSDQVLLPSENLAISGSGTERSVLIQPAVNQNGECFVRVRVHDGELTSERIFKLLVVAVNDFPTMSEVADQEATAGVTAGPIDFAVNDVDSAELKVSARSGNENLIPFSSIVVNGSGAGRTISFTPSATASGTTTIILVATDGSKSVEESFGVTVRAANLAPVISSLPGQTLVEDTISAELAFTISDPDTAASSLRVSARSSNPALIPDANIQLRGAEGNRSVQMMPALNATGQAVITLEVSDGAKSASTAFLVTVEAVNDYPTVSSIAPQTTYAGARLGPVAFTIGDAETGADQLRVAARTSNTVLVPLANISLGGSGANRTITVMPAANQYGTTKLYLIITDGSKTIERSFYFTSAP